MSAPVRASKWVVEAWRMHHCYIIPYVFPTKKAAEAFSEQYGTWSSATYEIPNFDPKMCPFTATATHTTSTTSTKSDN